MPLAFWRAKLFGVNALAPGAALAVVILVPIALTPEPIRTRLLGLQLLVIAAIYMGFAIQDGRPRRVVWELVGLAIFLWITMLGLWGNPYWLVAGYFGHGLWDMLHHERGIQTEVVRWYPPACVIYDWIFGAYLLVVLLLA